MNSDRMDPRLTHPFYMIRTQLQQPSSGNTVTLLSPLWWNLLGGGVANGVAKDEALALKSWLPQLIITEPWAHGCFTSQDNAWRSVMFFRINQICSYSPTPHWPSSWKSGKLIRSYCFTGQNLTRLSLSRADSAWVDSHKTSEALLIMSSAMYNVLGRIWHWGARREYVKRSGQMMEWKVEPKQPKSKQNWLTDTTDWLSNRATD